MIVELTHKKFEKLTSREKSKLWILRNTGIDSYFRDLFINEAQHKKTPTVVARTHDGIVGWGARMGGHIHVFVKPKFRRRGIGTMIHDELDVNWARVVRWNTVSTKFYDKIRKKLSK